MDDGLKVDAPQEKIDGEKDRMERCQWLCQNEDQLILQSLSMAAIPNCGECTLTFALQQNNHLSRNPPLSRLRVARNGIDKRGEYEFGESA